MVCLTASRIMWFGQPGHQVISEFVFRFILFLLIDSRHKIYFFLSLFFSLFPLT